MTAENGKVALKKITEALPDLIILDNIMQGQMIILLNHIFLKLFWQEFAFNSEQKQ